MVPAAAKSSVLAACGLWFHPSVESVVVSGVGRSMKELEHAISIVNREAPTAKKSLPQ
jgi:hypothetical protein